MSDDEPDDGMDALRRRLYEPGATEDDAARYRAALGVAAAPSHGLVDAAGPGRPMTGSSRGARARATGLLLLLGVASIAIAIAVATTSGGHVRSTRSTGPSLHAVTVQVPYAVRTGFVQALDDGRGSAFSDFIVEHPESRPPQLTTLTRAATEEHDGTGTRSIVLDPSALADHGGRMTVILIVSRDGTVRWIATRPALRGARRPDEREVAAQRLVQAAGSPVSTTFRYDGAGSTRLRVVVAPDVRWDATIVFSD